MQLLYDKYSTFTAKKLKLIAVYCLRILFFFFICNLVRTVTHLSVLERDDMCICEYKKLCVDDNELGTDTVRFGGL